MRRFILTLLILSVSIIVLGQKIEQYNIIIKTRTYKSYYNNKIKAPTFVIYKLFHGGVGRVSRDGMNFSGKLPHFAYTKSGYDKGHLAAAEDFSDNKENMLSTFNYINAIPQNPTCNRGIWKSGEIRVRQLSQTDSLLIICGGADWDIKKGVPKKCFKIVYSLTTGKLVFSSMVDNSKLKKNYQLSPEFSRKYSYLEVKKLYYIKPNFIW